MSEVTVQVQNPKQTININNPSITIEIPDNSIEVDILQPDQLSIQVQNPVIEVNIGGPCDCGSGGHEIQDEGTPLPTQPALNFIGAGVTVTDNPGAGTTDVTIPGGGSGGASIVEITYADMETALAGATLTPGQFYNITDASGTDLGFICQAVKADEITVNGTGGYLNADFQAVGDYTNTPETFGAQLGIWRTGFEEITIPYTNLSGGAFAVGDTITGGNTMATAVVDADNGSELTVYMTSAGVAFDGSEMLDNGGGVTADMDGAAGTPDIALGDVVIWNLLHYQLTDDTLLAGTNPATNTAAYTLLDKATYPETYVTAWDISEFDFANNWLQYRADERGNKIGYTKREDDANLALGYTAISDFQFGRDACYGNTSDDGYIGLKNQIGTFYRNSFAKSSVFQGCTLAENSSFYGNIFGLAAGAINCVFKDQSGFSNSMFESAAAMENITFELAAFGERNIFLIASYFSNCTFGPNSSFSNNVLENSAEVPGITAGANCSISRNKIGQGATLGGGTTMGDGSTIEGFSIGAAATVENLQMGDYRALRNWELFSGSYVGGIEMANNDSDFVDTNQRNRIGVNASIDTFTIAKGAEFSGNMFDAGDIEEVSIGEFSSFSANIVSNGSVIATNIGDGVSFSNNVINASIVSKEISATINGNTFAVDSDEPETIADNIENKRSIRGFSDIHGTIDITGLTNLDITAAWAQYRGIINLTSSNATESIDTITNPPTAFPFILRPAAGLALTITGTAYSGIAAGQIALKAADYTLDGDKGEYIVLEIDPLGSGCLVEKLVVNGLI